jgi:hypothetical protein
VIALAPGAHAWGWNESGTQTSPWTWRGERLPFVPLDLDWKPEDDPPSFVGWYRQSLQTYAAEAEAARIPAERFKGELLLVAGGDDRVWPSVEFAERIASVRADLPTRTVVAARAGHRPLFPGENPKSGGQRMARGGSDEADRELGALAWGDIRRVLTG